MSKRKCTVVNCEHHNPKKPHTVSLDENEVGSCLVWRYANLQRHYVPQDCEVGVRKSLGIVDKPPGEYTPVKVGKRRRNRLIREKEYRR